MRSSASGTCCFSGRGRPLRTSKRGWLIWTATPEQGRRLVETSLYPYEALFLERAYLQAILVAVQLAVYGEERVADLTEQLKAGARAQCFNGVLGRLSEVPLPPRL